MPFCPECREEFREGFTRCADCGLALVPSLPPLPEEQVPLPETGHGSFGGWDQVAETSQVFEAELIALRLREAGLPAQVVDQTFHQEPLPDVRAFNVVRVLVPAERAEEARRLLAQSVELPADAEASEGEGSDPESRS